MGNRTIYFQLGIQLQNHDKISVWDMHGKIHTWPNCISKIGVEPSIAYFQTSAKRDQHHPCGKGCQKNSKHPFPQNQVERKFPVLPYDHGIQNPSTPTPHIWGAPYRGAAELDRSSLLTFDFPRCFNFNNSEFRRGGPFRKEVFCKKFIGCHV